MGICTSTEAATPTTDKDKNKVDLKVGDLKASGEDVLQKNTLDIREDENVFKKYIVVKDLGVGSIGSVVCVRRNNTENELYALKTIRLGRVYQNNIDQLKNEVIMLRSLDHPNIVKVYELFTRDNRWMYVIMELLSGGDLYTRLPYTENQARRIMKKIVFAVSYMHDKGILHGDLSFENILFENDSSDAQVKIIDFGLSMKYKDNSESKEAKIGKIQNMAPEVLEDDNTVLKSDLWSIGVIAYMLLSGSNPFFQKGQTIEKTELIKRIGNCNFNFDDELWNYISKEAKDFISSLMVYDSKKRPTAAEALVHEWFKDEEDEDVQSDFHTQSNKQFDRFSNSAEIKKLALLFVAHKTDLANDEIAKLRDLFNHYDKDDSGTIKLDEFKDAMRSSDFSDDEIVEIYKSMDSTEDGSISYTEFIAATLEANCNINEEKIIDAFEKIDVDNSGFISSENLKQLLGKKYTEERANQIFQELNVGDKKQISREDFLKVFRKANMVE